MQKNAFAKEHISSAPLKYKEKQLTTADFYLIIFIKYSDNSHFIACQYAANFVFLNSNHDGRCKTKIFPKKIHDLGSRNPSLNISFEVCICPAEKEKYGEDVIAGWHIG